MENKHMERCSTLCTIRKMQSKTINTTRQLLEWPESRTLTTLNTGDAMEQQKLSFIADGNAKWYRYFGR